VRYSLGDKIGACEVINKSKEMGNTNVEKALEQYCK
jgi:hypothetical protein